MHYVALTALQSHWKGPKETLLLTDGCRLYDDGNEWKNYPSPIDVEQFLSIKKFETAYEYCNNIASQIMPVLSEEIEKKYLLKISFHAYEQLIYAWLFQFIQACYDRYTSVSIAIKEIPNVCFLTAGENRFLIRDTMDYMLLSLGNDVFNLNLYSDIIRFLGAPRLDVPIQGIEQHDSITIGVKRSIGWKETLTRGILTAYFKVSKHKQHLLYDCYGVPPLKSLLKSGAMRLLPSWHQKTISLPHRADDFRDKSLPIATQDAFVALLAMLIPRYLPVTLCEMLPDIVAWARKQSLTHQGVLATSTGLYTDPLLMALAGVSKLPFAIVEHGSVGMQRINFHEDVQRRCADRYYGTGCNLGFWLPSPYLALCKKRQKLSAPVLVANDGYRFLPRLHLEWGQGSMQPYHSRRISFLRLLPKESRPDIRLYFREFGWGVRKRLDAALPGLNYQNALAVPMEQVLADSCLLVLDHYGTTFHRAIATNCPTLIFTRPDIFSSRAEPVIVALRACGVWHDTPQSAAKFYMNLVGAASSWDSAAINILDWWTSGDVQKARKIFCDAYAQTSEHWAQDWITAFDILAEECIAKSSH